MQEVSVNALTDCFVRLLTGGRRPDFSAQMVRGLDIGSNKGF